MTPEQRFWRNVDQSAGPDGCWVYTKGLNQLGYGRIAIGPRGANKLHYAHRFAWELANGPLADADCVLHRCDNPPCVNVAHLFLGDRRENARDMASKGRQWKQRVTHCPHGHEYTPENTLLRSKQQQRVCRTCDRARGQSRRRKAA